MLQADSLIFDMDGTLWDAVDSYTKIWNTALPAYGVHRPPVTREELIAHMGLHLDAIIADLAPELAGDLDFYTFLDDLETRMMPVLKGRLYPGVAETMRQLARSKRLFMVSNCGSTGLQNFLNVSGLKPYITDALSHGETNLSKAENIRLLVERYNLKAPWYVGDTVTDCRAAHAAGIPVVWCSYGFGENDGADAVIDAFPQLLSLFPESSDQNISKK